MVANSPPPARAGVRAAVRYSPELGREICRRLAAGESQHALAREPGMPSRRTFGDWAAREPDFGAAYEAAKLAGRMRQLALDRRADQPRMWRKMLTRKGRRGGSVSPYTPELGEAICLRIAGGESVLAIGADPAMPCCVTIYNWARRNDDFREMYLRAKEMAADLLFDLSREIAMEATEASVRSDRLRIETLRWHTAMLAPKKYGTRRALGPEAGEGAGAGSGAGTKERQPFTVLIQRFADADGGPQFTDAEGNEVERPLGA